MSTKGDKPDQQSLETEAIGSAQEQQEMLLEMMRNQLTLQEELKRQANKLIAQTKENERLQAQIENMTSAKENGLVYHRPVKMSEAETWHAMESDGGLLG